MLSNQQLQWYANALEMAKCHYSFGRYSIVALAVKGNRVLSVGYNYYPMRRGGRLFDVSYSGMGSHAEVAALAADACVGTTMYIAGVTPSGREICTKPCGRCSMVLYNSQIRLVVYLNSRRQVKLVKRQELVGNVRQFNEVITRSMY